MYVIINTCVDNICVLYIYNYLEFRLVIEAELRILTVNLYSDIHTCRTNTYAGRWLL